MVIYDSILRITHGSSLLLDYGWPLATDAIELDGEQEVDVAPLSRASGVKTFSRGNDSHSIEFTIAEPEYSVRDAVVSAFQHAVNTPRTTEDVLIELETGWVWKLESATVQSWPCGMSGILPRRTVRLQGGAFTLVQAGSLDNPAPMPVATVDSMETSVDSTQITADRAA